MIPNATENAHSIADFPDIVFLSLYQFEATVVASVVAAVVFVFVLWRSFLCCSLAADGVVVCGLSIFCSFSMKSFRRCRGLAVLAPRLLLPLPNRCLDRCPDRLSDRLELSNRKLSDRVPGRVGLVSVPFLVVALRLLNVVVDDIDIDEKVLLFIFIFFCVVFIFKT